MAVDWSSEAVVAAVRRTLRQTTGEEYQLVDVTLTASELELAFRLHHDPRTYVATFPCAPPWLGWVIEFPAESREEWSSELRWTLDEMVATEDMSQRSLAPREDGRYALWDWVA